jgi:hypothetical protein
MLGASAICEHAIANQGVLFFGVSEQSGISSSANAGVGIMSGVATMDGNFTKTSAGILITGGANSDMSFSGLQSESTAFLVNLGVSSMESAFTETSNGIMIGSGVASKDLNFTKTSVGDIKFVEVNASATPESYVTITPSGTETYTEITPSGTETWTEIQ